MIQTFEKYRLITEDPDMVYNEDGEYYEDPEYIERMDEIDNDEDLDDDEKDVEREELENEFMNRTPNYTSRDAVTFGYKHGEFKNGYSVTHRGLGIDRDTEGAGRLWVDEKIISFWTKFEYKDDFEQFVKDVEYNIGVEVDDDWEIDDWENERRSSLEEYISDNLYDDSDYDDDDDDFEEEVQSEEDFDKFNAELEEKSRKRAEALRKKHIGSTYGPRWIAQQMREYYSDKLNKTESDVVKNRILKELEKLNKELNIKGVGSDYNYKDKDPKMSVAEYRAKKYQESYILSFEDFE